MLLRWHIFRPFEICDSGEAGPHVVAAVAAAGDPSTWVGPGEDDLISALEAEAVNVSADLTDTLGRVRDWPDYGGRNLRGYALGQNDVTPLSNLPNSFRDNFDQSGLPPAPV
jgi:hypothetical protein